MTGEEVRSPDFELIFTRHAAEYHELVMHEDWQGRLPRALAQAVELDGKTVVELGAGTGRVTGIIASRAARVLAFDRSQPMLDQAAAHLSRLGLTNVTLAPADNRAVPLPDGTADVVIEGWSFGHTVSTAPGGWRGAAEALMRESERLLKPGGTLVLLETLGTGKRTPQPPGPTLPVFYGLLERQLGFGSMWIRTDYRFPSLAEARRLIEFFFGVMVDYEVTPDGDVVVPECTGLWWRKKKKSG